MITYMKNLMIAMMSRIILRNILGWKYIDDSLNKKINNVVVYAHTSYMDTIIYILWCFSESIQVLIISNHGYPYIINKLLNFIQIDIITVDRTNNVNSAVTISTELLKRPCFLFGVVPEGSLHKVPDIKSGFYQIAKISNSSVSLLSLDYEQQNIKLKNITPFAEINIVSYDQIKQKILDCFKDEKVLCQHNFAFAPFVNTRRSVINLKRSFTIYMLPLIVLFILWISILNLVFK